MDPSSLDKEIGFYEANKAEYLRLYRGRFVIIKDENLCGDFASFAEAYQSAIKQFGDVSLLIQQVQGEEPTYSSPAMTLGILRAHVS